MKEHGKMILPVFSFFEKFFLKDAPSLGTL